VKLALKCANPAEWLALRAGLVPGPAAEAWGGMALSGVVIAAVRSGVTGRLAGGEATAPKIAADLGLDPLPTQLLLDCLRSGGYTAERSGRYRLTRRGRRWLDPASRLSVAAYVEGAGDYWSWWAGLPDTLRTGTSSGSHEAGPGDPYWQRYIAGQQELARLSAAEITRKLPMPRRPRALLDLGGGHGWYSASLCRRYPGLTATVLDLPGSAAVGREGIAAEGLNDRVLFRDGDVTTADLGDGYDAVLCFNLAHHLGPDQIADLFRRARKALNPGGTFAVLDVFADHGHRGQAHADMLALFVYLSSGAQIHTPAELAGWLGDAGFAAPRKIRLLRMPGLSLQVARNPG
jgi:SAM-dependent methyltransferase